MHTRRSWPVFLAVVAIALAGAAAACGSVTCVPLPTATADPTALPTEARPSPVPPPSATPTAPPTRVPDGPLVMIDAGHGGEDWGACHVTLGGELTLTEKEANLSIALHTRDALEARGVRVVLMRNSDVALNDPPVDVNEDGEIGPRDEVQRRVDIVNASGADLLLSIHQNAYLDEWGNRVRDVGGTVTYYCADRPFAEDNLRFATLVQEYSVAALHEIGYDPWDRGVRDDAELSEWGTVQHLVVLGPVTDRIVRSANMPGALTESLFMSNDVEAALLADDSVRQRLGEAYADAILAYFQPREATTGPEALEATPAADTSGAAP